MRVFLSSVKVHEAIHTWIKCDGFEIEEKRNQQALDNRSNDVHKMKLFKCLLKIINCKMRVNDIVISDVPLCDMCEIWVTENY